MCPVQEPSPRNMYSDAAGDFGEEPSVAGIPALHEAAARMDPTAGGLRPFEFGAANDVPIFLHVSSVGFRVC